MLNILLKNLINNIIKLYKQLTYIYIKGIIIKIKIKIKINII